MPRTNKTQTDATEALWLQEKNTENTQSRPRPPITELKQVSKPLLKQIRHKLILLKLPKIAGKK
jgi:hypothetical protein